MAMLFSCLAGAILLAIYIVMCHKKRNVKGLFVKSFVSVSYLLTCAFAIISNPEQYYFGILVMIGGILGLMGDIFLDQKWMYEKDTEEYLKIEKDLTDAQNQQTKKLPALETLAEKLQELKACTPLVDEKQKKATEIEAQFDEYDALSEKQNTVSLLAKSIEKQSIR